MAKKGPEVGTAGPEPKWVVVCSAHGTSPGGRHLHGGGEGRGEEGEGGLVQGLRIMTPEGRIIRETFADAEGRPVDRDDPAVASIEVEVLLPDGSTERTYAEVQAGGTDNGRLQELGNRFTQLVLFGEAKPEGVARGRPAVGAHRPGCGGPPGPCLVPAGSS